VSAKAMRESLNSIVCCFATVRQLSYSEYLAAQPVETEYRVLHCDHCQMKKMRTWVAKSWRFPKKEPVVPAGSLQLSCLRV
jgi:hypothetical protein